MRSVVPGLRQIDRQVICRVNFGDSCNGFYVRNSINFDHARGECRNTAYDTFIYHEYAHFADDRVGGLQNPSHAEGMADIVASFLSRQPGIGVGVRGGTTPLRSVDGDARWPAVGCNSFHCIGLTVAGFAWDVRAQLMRSLGDDEGRVLAEQLFISTLLANNQRIPELVTEVFLIDDDNGNLLDGTPHDEILHARAANRGFLHVPRIPRVDAISPSSAPTSRATRVLLTGRGFAFPETEVRIGGEPATIVAKSDDNGLTVLSPLSDTVGAADVVVTNRYGEARLQGQFLFTDEAWLEVPPVLTPGRTSTALVGGSPRSPYLLLASRHAGSTDLDPPGIEVSLGSPVRVLHDSLLGTDSPLDDHGLGSVDLRIPASAVERLARAGLPPLVHLQAIVLLSRRELRTTPVATLSIGR
jgi:hypothetical protein